MVDMWLKEACCLTKQRKRPPRTAWNEPFAQRSAFRLTAIWALFAAVPAVFAATVPEPLPVLTRTAQINALTPEQARAGYPVEIHGVVTFADVKLGHIFVHDQSAATFVYFDPTGLEPELRPGDTVEITGI